MEGVRPRGAYPAAAGFFVGCAMSDDAAYDDEGAALSFDDLARQALDNAAELGEQVELRAACVVLREPFSEPRVYFSVPQEDGDRMAHIMIETARRFVTEQ